MTYAAAITQLRTLTFTGLLSNLGAVDAVLDVVDLPALVIEDASQPFAESLMSAVVGWDAGEVVVFVDHLLLISGWSTGLISERWASRNLYFDRYLAALSANLTLGGSLVQPLSLVVMARGRVMLRNRAYNGIQFRHQWRIRI